MPDIAPPHDPSFVAAFQRPAWVVVMVAQMLLGLCLAVTLIVKYYMLVLSPDVCTPDGATLGNMIRCTSTLEIVAHFVLAVAGFRFAGFMFQIRVQRILPPLMVAFGGVLLMFLSALTPSLASWAIAATLVVMMLGIGAIYAAQILLRGRKSDISGAQ
ncbi:MAG: hypothetical protein ABJL99_06655 [Aliishimia sp.]